MGGKELEVTSDGKRIKKRLPFSGVKRTMARNLQESWQTAVTSCGFGSIEVDAVIALKNKLKEKGYKVTYTDIFIKLVAQSVVDNPWMNAAIVDNKIELYESVNVGYAIAAPGGNLLVPVIKEVQDMNIVQLAEATRAMKEKVMSGNIQLEDFQGGTITVSSMGGLADGGHTQVLVQPQVLIVGFGAIHEEPYVTPEHTIGIHSVVTSSTAVDHRLVMGSHGTAWSISLNNAFAEPEKYMGIDLD